MYASMLLRNALVALGLSAVGFAVHAADVLFYRQGERPDPADVARVLQPAASGALPARAPRMRGIRLHADERRDQQVAADASSAADIVQTAQSAPASAPVPLEATPRAVALQVQFAYNSAEISPEMVGALDAVAEGIRIAGGEVRVIIEGHTDAHGSEDYNLVLSMRRASAVKQFLVSRHGIRPDMLVVLGRGKSVPLVAENPFAPENRRVEFRATQ